MERETSKANKRKHSTLSQVAATRLRCLDSDDECGWSETENDI